MSNIVDWREVSGQIAGLIALLSFIPYIVSTIWGTTRPNRVTWGTWSFVQVILTATFWQSSENHEAIWVSVGYTVGVILVAMLSVKHGQSDKLDWVSIVGIGITIVIWYLAGALEGLVVILLVDGWAALPTVKKSALDPKSESFWSWVLGFIANTINLIAINNWHEPEILYPLYFFVLTGTVSYLLLSAKLGSKH